MPAGRVLSVSISPERGTAKTAVQQIELIPGSGIQGDGHAGEWHRQVSLIAQESVERVRKPGEDFEPGDFAENIRTQGIELHTLPLKTTIRVGSALLEITQIGKDLREHPSIFELKGDGLMPREGVFARVLQGGTVMPGDPVETASIPGKEA